MEKFFKKIVTSHTSKEKIIDDIRNNKKPVLIYGAGVYAYVLSSYLIALGIKIKEFLVDRSLINDRFFIKVKPKSLEEFIPKIDEYNLIIGISSYPAIIYKLKKKGLKKVFVIDVPDFLNFPKPFLNFNFVKKKSLKLNEVYNLFEDDISKETFIAFINTKLTNDLGFLKPIVKRDHLYFPNSEFKISKKETLLDVGGFNGDTIRDFLKISNSNFDMIISLEPLYENFLKLKQTITEFAYNKKIIPLMVGAWHKADKLSFKKTNLNIDSRVHCNGKEFVEVNTIDNIANKLGLNISLVKIDINGYEFNALKGSSEIIKRFKPNIVTKIQVKEDLYRIPLLLKKFNPEIKLYLRQRNYMSMMLVLYARFN